MGINDNNKNYNQNGKNEVYSPTVYSPYKMSNTMSEIDPGSLNFTYWRNSLKVSISPMKPSNDPNDVSFDHKNAVDIYLSHTKARILYNEICLFQTDPDMYNSSGVPSGEGLITISNGSEFGVDNAPCLVIRKIDGETGKATSSYAYQFKKDYHYAIRNYDETTGNFDKHMESYQGIEIEQFKTLLIEYYTAMTGAFAFSVMEMGKYEKARNDTKLDAIANKLGVQFKEGKNSNKSSNSFFNNNSGSQSSNYSSSSLDDINQQFED